MPRGKTRPIIEVNPNKWRIRRGTYLTCEINDPSTLDCRLHDTTDGNNPIVHEFGTINKIFFPDVGSVEVNTGVGKDITLHVYTRVECEMKVEKSGEKFLDCGLYSN